MAHDATTASAVTRTETAGHRAAAFSQDGGGKPGAAGDVPVPGLAGPAPAEC